MLFLTVSFVDIKRHACVCICYKSASVAPRHTVVIGDQSDAVTQNAWFRCMLCAAISGEISILIQTGAESWGRFPVPRICRWESIASCIDSNCTSAICNNF